MPSNLFKTLIRSLGYDGATNLILPLIPTSVFNPTLYSGLKFWFDPSQLDTLFQDALGTIPVTTAGDPVGLVIDLSSLGNNAVQTIDARRPIYQTDGVLHWLEFNVTLDHHMVLPISVQGANTSSNTAVFAVRVNNVYYSYVFGTTSDFGYGMLFLTSYIRPFTRGTAGVIGGNGTTFNRYNDIVYSSDWDALTSTLRGWMNLNKELELSAGVPSTKFTPANMWLGAGSNASIATFDGRMYGGCIYDEKRADNERILLQEYMALKGGIAL